MRLSSGPFKAIHTKADQLAKAMAELAGLYAQTAAQARSVKGSLLQVSLAIALELPPSSTHHASPCIQLARAQHWKRSGAELARRWINGNYAELSTFEYPAPIDRQVPET